MNDDPFETAITLGAAGAAGAIFGFFVGVATVILALAWYTQ